MKHFLRLFLYLLFFITICFATKNSEHQIIPVLQLPIQIANRGISSAWGFICNFCKGVLRSAIGIVQKQILYPDTNLKVETISEKEFSEGKNQHKEFHKSIFTLKDMKNIRFKLKICEEKKFVLLAQKGKTTSLICWGNELEARGDLNPTWYLTPNICLPYDLETLLAAKHSKSDSKTFFLF